MADSPSEGLRAAGATPGHTGESSCDPPCVAGPDARAVHALPRGTCVRALLRALLVPLAVAAVWVRAREGGVRVRLERAGTAVTAQQGFNHTHNERGLEEELGAQQGRLESHKRRRLEAEAMDVQAGGKGQGKAGEEPFLCPEDRDLFARALATRPAGGTPRIAFLLLCRGPLPLAPSGPRSWKDARTDSPCTCTQEEGFQYNDNNTPAVFQGRQIPSKVSYRKPQGALGNVGRG